MPGLVQGDTVAHFKVAPASTIGYREAAPVAEDKHLPGGVSCCQAAALDQLGLSLPLCHCHLQRVPWQRACGLEVLLPCLVPLLGLHQQELSPEISCQGDCLTLGLRVCSLASSTMLECSSAQELQVALMHKAHTPY